MDRKWFQYIVTCLNFALVKGVVKVGALILVVQLVLWLWNGSWPEWSSIKGIHNAGDTAPLHAWKTASDLPAFLQTPAVLSWMAWFFFSLPLFLFVPLAGWGTVGLFYLAVVLIVSVLVQISAFFRQVLLRKRRTPPKHIAICIDGTWNYPENMSNGVINGTNVYKFWDLLEGTRRHHAEFWVGANRLKTHVETVTHDGKTKKVRTQLGFYYNGVGNKAEHTQLGIILGGAFGLGAKRIVKNAYRDLIRYYREGDSISICGFSRGAAIARLLASEIGKRGLPRYAFSDLPVIRLIALPIARKIGTLRRPRIDLLGVWDTVGAFGISKNIMGIPFQKINLFKDLNVGETVQKAIHMLALDEQRDSFVPTLITPSNDPNRTVKEVWFAGNHSNVGGGYPGDTLCNIPLRYLCMEAKQGDALPLLKFRSEEDLLEQDAAREELRKARLAELTARGERELRPDEYALYGFNDEDELAPILFPPDGFAERIKKEAMARVRKEQSPVYENAPREVPFDAIIDDSVRYKIVKVGYEYQPASVMAYHKRRMTMGEEYLKFRRALFEGRHLKKGDLDKDEKEFPQLTSLLFAFTEADWLPPEWREPINDEEKSKA